MTEDMSSLNQRITQLEARVTVLEQPKKARTKRVKSTAGNINLDDDADLFPTPARAATAKGSDGVSFGAVDLGTLE